MTLFLKTATALTTASLLSLGVALAQEAESDDTAAAEAEVEATVETEAEAPAEEAVEKERAVMGKSEVTDLAESNFTKADANGDEMLDEQEYIAFNRGAADQLKKEYEADLDTDIEITSAQRDVDVTSSASIAALLESNDERSYYEDAEASPDKVANAAETRFAEVSTDGTVNAETLIAAGSESFDRANQNGDEVLEGEEIDRFAEDYTGLEASAEAEATVEEETEDEAGS